MTTHLREELTALADTQSFSPDPSAWDRGRRVRRRDRVARGAAVLAVVAVVAGAGVLAARPDAVGPAGGVDREAAIPSVIPEPDGPKVTDLAIGRASVAYVDAATGMPVLVDAATGEASYVELPDFPVLQVVELLADRSTGPLLALSPDGRQVAYAATIFAEGPEGQPSFSTSWYRVVDLTTGEATLVEPPEGTSTPLAMSWTADGRIAVDVYGDPTAKDQEPPIETWTIDPATGDTLRTTHTGVLAPGAGVPPAEAAVGGVSANYPTDAGPVTAAPFELADGTDLRRDLPVDLHPDGAVVTPIGWADDSLLVARVDDDLVLLTSPVIPESEWTWQVLVSDVPATSSLSLAVDLVPDLDGTSSQELTHDFTASPPAADRDISWIIGLGVAAAIAVLLGLQWLWRRLT